MYAIIILSFFIVNIGSMMVFLRQKLVAINKILTYLLTAIGLTLGGSSTVHIYTVEVVQYTFTHEQYIEQHN
jgi:hypothetical protein